MRLVLGFVGVAMACALALLLIGTAALLGKRWAKAERCGLWACVIALGTPGAVLLLLFAASAVPRALGWALLLDALEASVPVSQKARVLAETISALMNLCAIMLALLVPGLLVWLVGRAKRRTAVSRS
jgi:hypothetical protein